MCPSYARVSRAVRRARERYATFAIERTIPASSASQPFESPVASSRAASSHARHAHVVLLARSFIDTHTRTHYHRTHHLNVSDRPRVRPTESSTSRRRDPSRRRFTTHRPPSTSAADARRAHYTHTHARTHPSRAPTHAHRTTRRRFVRLLASDRPRRSPAHSPRGHRARTARPPASSSVHTNVEHSF